MTQFGIEIVHVGSCGHLTRYKVVDAGGTYVPGGLFKTLPETERFIAERTPVAELTQAQYESLVGPEQVAVTELLQKIEAGKQHPSTSDNDLTPRQLAGTEVPA